ncbi:MAG: NHLP leader peptide family RiPP precursor [Desulfoferrobacter sp.]
MEKNPLQEILIRACSDKPFREKFIKDPKEILQSASIQVPENITIRILENSDDQIYIVLPTSLEEQPAEWAYEDWPTPGETFETAGLTIKWTERGLSLLGRIGSESAAELRRQLDRATGSLLIDFSQVTFMSSAGLGILLSTQKRLAANQNELYLYNVSAPIKNIFSLSGLDSVFQFVTSESDNTWWMAYPNV